MISRLSNTASQKDIENFLNIDLDIKNVIDNVNNEQFHNFSGNKMRWRKVEAIKKDVSWVSEMGDYEKKILGFLSKIPNKKWVYNNKK